MRRLGLQRPAIDAFHDWMNLRADARHAGVTARMVRRFLWFVDGRAACGLEARRRPGPRLADAFALETAGDVAAWLAHEAKEGHSPKTLRNLRTAASDWFEYCIELKLRSDNPALAVRLAKLRKRLPRHLTEPEAEAAVASAAHAGCLPEVLFALASGLRRGEMSRLEWGDIDRTRRVFHVQITKNKEPRTEPLSEAALQALELQRVHLESLGCGGFAHVFPARRFWRNGWRYEDRERCEKTWRNILLPVQAAVPKFTRDAVGCGRGWHLFRKTLGTRLGRANVSDRNIAKALGHRDVRAVEPYVNMGEEYDPVIEKGSRPLELPPPRGGKALGNRDLALGEERPGAGQCGPPLKGGSQEPGAGGYGRAPQKALDDERTRRKNPETLEDRGTDFDATFD